jgi:hypothetical protein
MEQPITPNSRPLNLKNKRDLEAAYYGGNAAEIILAVPYEQRPNTVKNCLLCGKPAENFGVFIPDEAIKARLGTPVGKLRVIVYGFCSLCWENPDAPDRVEDIILRDVNVQ